MPTFFNKYCNCRIFNSSYNVDHRVYIDNFFIFFFYISNIYIKEFSYNHKKLQINFKNKNSHEDIHQQLFLFCSKEK